ncbi:MAG: hypothetical protein RRY35_06210, partial [Clostridiales bacterium]
MSQATINKKKKHFTLPDAWVLMMIIVVIAIICTWIIPAGEYARETDPDTGNTMVVPGSYANVEQNPVGILGLFCIVPKALQDVAGIFFFVILIGGGLSVVSSTGAFNAMVNALLRKMGNNGRLLIFLLVYFFGLCSSSAGFCSEYLVFIPILITLFRAMGYDAMVAIGLTMGAASAGYGAAPINPFNVGVSQSMAGLPMFSGMGLRWVLWFIAFTALAMYLYHYAEKVRKNPSASLIPDYDYSAYEIDAATANDKITGRQKIILGIFFAAIAFLIFASVKGNILGPWYTYSAIFFVMGILCGVVAGYSGNKIVEVYLDGCKNFLYAATVLGAARAICMVLEDGQIIDTIVKGLVAPLQLFGSKSAYAASIIMTWIQVLLNVIMPSNSGQALATMPILLP